MQWWQKHRARKLLKSGQRHKKAVKTSGYFRSLLTGRKRIVLITTVLMATVLLGALYCLTTHFKNKQEPVVVSNSQGSGGLSVSSQPSNISISLGNEAPQASDVIKQINDYRTANGLSPVSENGSLDKSATAKLSDMIARNYWSHNEPNGTEPWVFIKQAGYNYRYAGENLWYGKNNTTVTDWINSPTHKAVMLDGRYTDVGIAIQKAANYNGNSNVYVVVTHYAAPLGSSGGSYQPNDNTSSSSVNTYNYQLPNYSSTPPPSFDRPSPTYTPPTQQCVGNVDSSYSC